MASCHAITYVNGELIGDPLEVRMFEQTNWHYEEPTDRVHDVSKMEVLANVKPKSALA